MAHSDFPRAPWLPRSGTIWGRRKNPLESGNVIIRFFDLNFLAPLPHSRPPSTRLRAPHALPRTLAHAARAAPPSCALIFCARGRTGEFFRAWLFDAFATWSATLHAPPVLLAH